MHRIYPFRLFCGGHGNPAVCLSLSGLASDIRATIRTTCKRGIFNTEHKEKLNYENIIKRKKV